MYTLEMAMARAKRLGLRIYTAKSFNKAGRRVFLVDSQTRDLLKHAVVCTPSGFACDCKSYEHRSMCAHIGCVVSYIRSLTVAQRTFLLTPRKPLVARQPVVVTQKVNTTTTIGAATEAHLPAICMRGGRDD